MEYLPGRIRGVRGTRSGNAPGVVLQACPPGTVDDYGSLWKANTFDKSLRTRLPVLCWGHDWTDPLGPAVRANVTPSGPVVEFRFSDFDAVPSARRAYAQLQDGTITDCSVGFSGATRREPTATEKRQYDGIREVIETATLDEVSLVLRGAVPGAKVMAVRSSWISEDDVVAIARKVDTGEWTKARAQAEITRLSRSSAPARRTSVPTRSASRSSYSSLDAEIDAALALVEGP